MEIKNTEEKILNLSDGRQVKVQYITYDDGFVSPEVDEEDPFNIEQNICEEDYDLIHEALGPEFEDR